MLSFCKVMESGLAKFTSIDLSIAQSFNESFSINIKTQYQTLKAQKKHCRQKPLLLLGKN